MDARDWLRNREDLTLLWGLVDRLALEPGSQYRALELGGHQWFGWSFVSDEIAASTVDSIYALMSATAQARPKVVEVIPRPVVKTEKKVIEVKASRLSELNWGSALQSAGI